MLQNALEIDPLSIVTHSIIVDIYSELSRFDEAIEQYTKAAEIDPYHPVLNYVVSNAYVFTNKFAEAIASMQKHIEISPTSWAKGQLGNIYGMSGNKEKAEQILDELKERNKATYVSSYSFALIYLGLGENDLTLKSLQESAVQFSTRLWLY